MQNTPPTRLIAIACGGTGGHLFPGLGVAAHLVREECAVTLLISPKEVDQQAVKAASDVTVVTLPAVALNRGGLVAFLRGFAWSYCAAGRLFKVRRPHAVLAMGGFTSAPPILAGKKCGAATFVHESNTIPGRANRWLSRVVDQAFVGFPETASRLRHHNVAVTGTPVRAQFRPRDPGECRKALGLEPDRPVLVVTGGSQGASGINELVIQSLSLLVKRAPQLQWVHLSGPNDFEKVRQAYANLKLSAAVHPFLAEMEVALGAATVAISRAGASSLAELAALRVPAVLIPYPSAADNHQFHNARAFEQSGAARLLEQQSATPELLGRLVSELVENGALREGMSTALAQWHRPRAAAEIAEFILQAVARRERSDLSGGRTRPTVQRLASDATQTEDAHECGRREASKLLRATGTSSAIAGMAEFPEVPQTSATV